jgi:HAD superfamily hydrolase (TIGR01549 family)
MASSSEGLDGDRAAGVAGWTGVRAVLFDVDGTLYGQTLIRLLMGAELLSLPASYGSISRARRVWRAIGAFRKIREELRAIEPGQGNLAVLQYTETARRTGEDAADIERWVDEWIHRRPLKYLRSSRRIGLEGFLSDLAHAEIRAGVLSDYPADAKLTALGLEGRFTLSLCTTDPDIGAFKPHPAGFLRACALWGLRPHEVLYVGDRPDVDAAGAAAAGMPCAIIGGAGSMAPFGRPRHAYVNVPFYGRLQRALARPRRA